MSRVVFITPNLQGHFSDSVLGTAQLATILDKQGIDCEVLPFFRIGELTDLTVFLDRAMALLAQKMPKIVSFYTRCDTYHIMLKLAQRIKARWPEMYVVLGGPQADITAEETIRQLPYVDFVCCGEGETTIAPFFSSLLQGAPDTTVDGLVYRENGTVKSNPRPPLLQDLDTLPMLNLSFLHHTPTPAKNASFPIDVGRGCPFGCTYCSTKTFWGRKFRLKSPARIAEEIQYFHRHFGVSTFSFSHDMFTLKRDAVLQTCRLIKQLPFSIDWRCSARLDCIDRELVDIMLDAGMSGMYIGIETGSPRMQKLINKNLDLNNALPMISYLTEKGCKVIASFIFGFPEETEEDLSHTMQMIAQLLKLRNISVQTHLCTFLSGTELAQRHQSEMTPAEQTSDITGDLFLADCRDLTDAHPALFQHLLEYKTPMRTRLRYFPLFFRSWQQLQPVYQHLSARYPNDRLVDMYDDFVAANGDILDGITRLPYEQQRSALLQQDRFPATFTDDPCFDIISDVHRFRIAEASARNADGKETCETYCFNPADIHKKSDLRDYTRCIAMVRRKDGKTTIACFASQNS